MIRARRPDGTIAPADAHALTRHREIFRLRWSMLGTVRWTIEFLLASNVTQRAALSLFQGAATFPAIRSWRYGEAAPPRWAIELLDRELAAEIEAIQELRRQLGTIRQKGPSCNISGYNAKRARIRDALIQEA